MGIMKSTDDPKAKFKIWLERLRVAPMPEMPPLFSGKKSFRNYDELADWKRELLIKLAKDGGVRWTNTFERRSGGK